MSQPIQRRTFVKSIATAGLVAPVLSPLVKGASANEKITHASILLLLATGVAQWVMLHDVYEQGNKALIASMLGTKVLIALGIFTIIFAQAFGVLKGPPGRWAKVGMVMGVLVVILAGVVRTLRLDALGG